MSLTEGTNDWGRLIFVKFNDKIIPVVLGDIRKYMSPKGIAASLFCLKT